MVTSLNQTPTFELYMVRCGPNIGYKKNMCSKKIGLHAQNMRTILNLIFNINGKDPCDHLMSTHVFTLIMIKIFIRALKIMRKVAKALMWIS